jgi:hypothetical protein
MKMFNQEITKLGNSSGLPAVTKILDTDLLTSKHKTCRISTLLGLLYSILKEQVHSGVLDQLHLQLLL